MKKAVFLDRDGVINIDKGYVSKISDFEWCDGVFDALLRLQDNGYYLFVITNQSGIGRKYYTLSDFELLSSYMLDELKKHGIEITKLYFCPHAPSECCACRKPSPAMILQACAEFEINPQSSALIGDKDSDIEAGKAANVGLLYKIGDKYKNLNEIANDIINKEKK